MVSDRGSYYIVSKHFCHRYYDRWVCLRFFAHELTLTYKCCVYFLNSSKWINFSHSVLGINCVFLELYPKFQIAFKRGFKKGIVGLKWKKNLALFGSVADTSVEQLLYSGSPQYRGSFIMDKLRTCRGDLWKVRGMGADLYK